MTGARAAGGARLPLARAVRVLVVEDESLVAMMLADMLEEIGCTVVDATGKRLGASVKTPRPDPPPFSAPLAPLPTRSRLSWRPPDPFSAPLAPLLSRSRLSWRPSCRVLGSPGAPRGASAALPLRRALLAEGFQALGGVLAHEQAPHRLALQGHGAVQGQL